MTALAQNIRLGLFFLFGLVLICVVYETLSDALLYSDRGYEVVAPFEDLRQLKYRCGCAPCRREHWSCFESLFKNGTEIAMLSIEPGVKIPTNYVATITTAELLANNYVAVLPGNDKTYLNKGDTIKTKATLNFNDVMEEVGNIAKKLNKLVDENAEKLTQTIDNLESVTAKINDGEGTLGMLVNSDQLHQQLLAAAENMSQFMADAREIVDKINSGEGALSKLLNNPDMAEQVRETVANLEQFREKLNSDKSTLGRLISSDDLYVRAEAVMTKVESAGPITAVGVAANALF